MTTAILFPGQGTDLGDLVAMWGESPRVAALLDVAARALAMTPAQLARPRATTPTTALQPVLTALTIGIYEELVHRGVRARFFAGHSLGEVAACAAAGAIAGEAAVELAGLRGRLMAREAARHRGGMLAVTGTATEVERAVAHGASAGRVVIAARNTATEWALSGDDAALRAISRLLPATPIAAGGPWHSLAMAGAVDEYQEALHRAMSGPLRAPVVCNRTGEELYEVARLPELLAGQLVHPVEWAASMETLRRSGVRDVMLCGPGKALRRFARAGIPGATVLVVATPSDLAAASSSEALAGSASTAVPS